VRKCHGTLQGRGLLKSHGLSETPIVWRNTSDTFPPRGLGYNRSSCELVKCFELKESDNELRRSCLRRQPACLQPCARLVMITASGICHQRKICWRQPEKKKTESLARRMMMIVRRCLRDFSVFFWRVLVCLKAVFSDGQDVKYDRDITPRPHI